MSVIGENAEGNSFCVPCSPTRHVNRKAELNELN